MVLDSFPSTTRAWADRSLASPFINGRWELLYTTSGSIIGKNKPRRLRPFGPIYQVLALGATIGISGRKSPNHACLSLTSAASRARPVARPLSFPSLCGMKSRDERMRAALS